MMVSAEDDPRRAGTIWTLSLDESPVEIKPLVPTVFCHLESQSASELAEAMGRDALDEIQKRFEKGSRCYAARVNGEIAAYGWVSFEDEFIGELNLRLRLLRDEAYIWNCATLPAFRQNLLYSALLIYMVDELRKEPLHRVWIGADLENVPSQRGIARAGFTHVADLVVARVLTLRQVWVQGGPDMPDSLVADARRVFLNNRDKVWLKALSSAISS
jgi:predicted acetyltransferase